MTDAGPTARALLALDAIGARPGVGVAELARRLEVSERAARRAVAVLRAAGVPVESTRGPYGGYRIGRGLRLPPLMFTQAEAMGLVMTVLDSHSSGTGAAADALDKLVRALPEPVARPVEAMRRVASPNQDAVPPPSSEVIAQLVAACVARRVVRVRHGREGRETDIEPWALVPRQGRWYLLCFSRTRQARRALRVDRIAEVTPEAATFVPPAEIDPVEAVAAQLGEGWDHRVEVHVDAPPERVGRWVPRYVGSCEPGPDGGTRLRGSTSDCEWYAGQLAQLRVPWRVIDPPELRAAVAALGHRALDASRSCP